MFRVNGKNQQPIQIYDIDIDDVQEFTYLGSNITVDGNVEMEYNVPLPNYVYLISSSQTPWYSWFNFLFQIYT